MAYNVKMSRMTTRARSQSIHITICHHNHGRTRRTSRCGSCAPAVVKIEKKETIKSSYKSPTKTRNEVKKTRRNTRAKSEDIVSHDRKKSTSIMNENQAKKTEIPFRKNTTKSPVIHPQPEPTNIFKPQTRSKDKIKIVSTHKQFSNYNMNSLKEKFEKIDKMSRLDRAHRAAAGGKTSGYVRSNFIDNSAVETHKNGTIAEFTFSNDFGSSGLIHMKPAAISDTSTQDSILVSLMFN